MNYIIELEALDGEETVIHLEADGESVPRLWAVVRADAGGAGIVDNGYRSLAEARAAWPEAVAPGAAALTPDAADQSYVVDRGKPSIE
jgi:hypothetical protein